MKREEHKSAMSEANNKLRNSLNELKIINNMSHSGHSEKLRDAIEAQNVLINLINNYINENRKESLKTIILITTALMLNVIVMFFLVFGR